MHISIQSPSSRLQSRNVFYHKIKDKDAKKINLRRYPSYCFLTLGQFLCGLWVNLWYNYNTNNGFEVHNFCIIEQWGVFIMTTLDQVIAEKLGNWYIGEWPIGNFILCINGA